MKHIRMSSLWILTALILRNSEAFSTPSPDASTSANRILVVTPIQTPQDVAALAKLRYDEWMTGEPEDQRPSPEAFQMATAEIVQERAEGHAVAFLARLVANENENENENDNGDAATGIVVGAAELSPIELKGCIQSDFSTPNCRYLYVTDFVTARNYRRKGVATALMKELERYSVQNFRGGKTPAATSLTTKLLLHVKYLNHAALGFYKKLGYKVIDTWTTEVTMDVDIKRLAKNAGTRGQLLMVKKIRR